MPTLLALPPPVLVKIFESCPTAITAKALSQTHPILRTLYQFNDIKIHTTLANRNFGALALSVFQCCHPSKTSFDTEQYLPSIADDVAIGPLFKQRLSKAKGDRKETLKTFPFFWKLCLRLAEHPIDSVSYGRMAFEIRFALFESFKGLVSVDGQAWKEALEKHLRNEPTLDTNAEPEASEPKHTAWIALSERSEENTSHHIISMAPLPWIPTPKKQPHTCPICLRKKKLCHWHNDLSSHEGDFHFQLNLYHQNDILSDRPFPASLLWEAFLHYMLFFISGAPPLPANMPPQFEDFSCTDPTCPHCVGPDSEFGGRLFPGGDHVWDYSLVETLTQTQAEALGFIEESMVKTKVYPFCQPYRNSPAHQSYYSYWKALAKYAKVDRRTGKLMGVEKAKKKLLARRFQPGKVVNTRPFKPGGERFYCEREIEVEAFDGSIVKKRVVEDCLVWADLVWWREERVRRHQGLEKRGEQNMFLYV